MQTCLSQARARADIKKLFASLRVDQARLSFSGNDKRTFTTFAQILFGNLLLASAHTLEIEALAFSVAPLPCRSDGGSKKARRDKQRTIGS